MADFGYNNNAIRNQKHFKPIANGNSRMITLTDEPLPCWKPKKEWKFKCKSWIKKTHQLLLCFSQNIAKHKLTAYLMHLCYFFSYLYKYLNRYWANQLDIFITISTKRATSIATKYIRWYTTISKIVHPSLSKNNVYQSFISGNILIYKLVHTSSGNR